jgi:hypothetical protein
LLARQARNRIPIAENTGSDQGLFGEDVSGIPKGSTGNRIMRETE